MDFKFESHGVDANFILYDMAAEKFFFLKNFNGGQITENWNEE